MVEKERKKSGKIRTGSKIENKMIIYYREI